MVVPKGNVSPIMFNIMRYCHQPNWPISGRVHTLGCCTVTELVTNEIVLGCNTLARYTYYILHLHKGVSI